VLDSASPMLRIYRRHRTYCPQTSERYRRCSCPIYVEGTLGGETVRKALDQTSWQAASDLIASWTAAGRVGAVRTEIPPIDTAVQKYVDDATARHLHAATIQKQKNLLERRLLKWCASKPTPVLGTCPARAWSPLRSHSRYCCSTAGVESRRWAARKA
jgi:integrase/recombinase XerD